MLHRPTLDMKRISVDEQNQLAQSEKRSDRQTPDVEVSPYMFLIAKFESHDWR